MTPGFWQKKPWWCQPWSILLTGIGTLVGGWWITQRWWIVVGLGCPVVAWWWLFLVLAPRLAEPGSGPEKRSSERRQETCSQ
ncbi:MAG: hypothetical protein TE42_05980 [Candidatus Synechococcus spongiarum SP3]|uniref:DUF6737 domain-containing protein n=1 Tax=Candidatus Synechococcus spongiarum SP3 TaxID=1604020 RepID=A0A0G2HLR4_9SYNE|nr:MAG: hypothetical protein TE42_05980 [Candidatus Synechococcus spongiarum SP3]